jgi:hypothetical protein
MLLMGVSQARQEFEQYGLLERTTPNEEWVVRVNECVCRYAYEAVYANSLGQEETIARYVTSSPVRDECESDDRMVFGSRKKQPKWSSRSAGDL